MSNRLRLAYFSPLPPTHTGVADYSFELLPALAARATVTLYVDEPAEVEQSIAARWLVRPIAAYAAERWDFDAAVFQMGNSSFHEALYRAFCHYPGIVVLHDYSLHHFVAERTIGRGQIAGYRRELAYALGDAGMQIGREIRHDQRALPLFDFPLNDRVLDLSLGVIAHSQFVAARVRRPRAHLPLRVIPAPIAAYTPREKRCVPGWPDDALIFASVGQVIPSKQIDLVLRAFAAMHSDFPQTRFLIVGEWRHPALSLDTLLGELNLREVVHHIGFVEDLSEFSDWIAAADVVVNLRHPTVGETSATALRALAAGRPLIVFDEGWYSELPGDLCIKVAPLNESALTTAMSSLAGDVARREQMGWLASAYARRVHSPDQAAVQYIEFVGECVARWQVRAAE